MDQTALNLLPSPPPAPTNTRPPWKSSPRSVLGNAYPELAYGKGDLPETVRPQARPSLRHPNLVFPQTLCCLLAGTKPGSCCMHT